MTDGLDRLKVLINSSTPIVVMETSEEMHAVKMVRSACVELNMATASCAPVRILRSTDNRQRKPRVLSTLKPDAARRRPEQC